LTVGAPGGPRDARPERGGHREERLADLASLRRMERLAVAWTVVGAVGLVIVSRSSAPAASWAAAILQAAVLTGVSAASIVSFRGLQRIVSTLGPADQDTRKQRTIGWRQGLAALLRLCLLGALVIGGSLQLGSRFSPALVLGFSTLPAALMTEGLLQVVRALRGKEHDGFS